MVSDGTDLGYPLFEFAIDRNGKRARDENFKAIASSSAERLQEILQIIIDAGERGTTVDEISARLSVPPNCVSGRVTQLKRLGLCTHTAERRRTRSGASAAVLVACVRGDS